MLGRVTKYRIKNDAPSEVFEADGDEERQDRHLNYADRVRKRLDIKAVQSESADKNELVFDLVGVDASIANALRRILLAEVATVAIEHVYMFMNSSIIHDEILAHRLGLIPIMANPRMFEFMGEEGGEQDEPTEFNTCVFKLEVKNPADPADMPDPMPKGMSYAAGPRRTLNVFSGAMEWCPHGEQAERFEEEGGLRPVHDDILIAKLRPGQEIVAESVVQKQVPRCKVFPVGSFPLKTYLPCADVDMVMFLPPSSTSVTSVRSEPAGESEVGQQEGTAATIDSRQNEKTGTMRTPALVAVNQALCSVAVQSGCRRRGNVSWPHSDETAKPEIRNVSFINARTPIVTMVVGNVVVDLTENQGGSVAASALLEETDRWIGRDHLFKRSLLLLKAWALCETPRLVGQRVLGAREGGLTSYGLSVMVLHLFASRSSADTLVHPLDVFVRFFQVFSEFDWARDCLTVDGPVAFDNVREHRIRGSKASSTNSRLWPLVDKVLAHLSPAPAEKAGRVRGRRASRSGAPRSDVPDTSSKTSPGFWGVADSPATAHFPVRHCNIQDPLNGLNNLGHSVSRRSLKALEGALQQGQQQLEALQLSPPPSGGNDHRRQRRSRDVERVETVETGRLNGGRGVANERVSGGADRGVEDRSAWAEGARLEPIPQPVAVPLVAPANAPPLPIPHRFVPHVQFLRLPTVQAVHPGAIYGPTHAALVPPALVGAQQLRLSYPPPLPLLPNGYQLVYHPHMVQPGQPGVLRPHSAVLLPAGAQAHPELVRQWNWQRIAQGGVQGELQQQIGLDQHQRFVSMQGDQGPPHARNHGSGSALQEARPRSAPWSGEGQGRRSSDPPVVRHGEEPGPGLGAGTAEKENRKGGRRKNLEEDQPPDQAIPGTILPWDLTAFVNSSPTSSTASMSEFAGDGTKEEQDGHLLYESGGDDEVQRARPPKEENAAAHPADASDRRDAIVNRSPQNRGGGQAGGVKRARKPSSADKKDGASNGNLWANWFLREVFPHCCQLYASGDGFREDLLDHPCQHWSKLQERGSPPPRRPGSRDILQGASMEIWSALETIGQMMRGAPDHPLALGAKEEGTGTESDDRAVARTDGGGKGGGARAGAAGAQAGCQAELEQRAAQSRRPDAVVARVSGGHTGDDAGVGELSARPKRRASNTDRSQPLEGSGANGQAMEPADDETGYTTSEELGDKGDTPLGPSHASKAFSTLSPSVDGGAASPDRAESPAHARPQLLTASTQTQPDAAVPRVGVDRGIQCVAPAGADIRVPDAAVPRVGVDKGMQCVAPAGADKGVQCVPPVRVVMVSRADQCGTPSKYLNSQGVQCTPPAPPPGISCGTQCRQDAAQIAVSTGVQCLLEGKLESDLEGELSVAAEPTPSAAAAVNCADPGSSFPRMDDQALNSEASLGGVSEDDASPVRKVTSEAGARPDEAGPAPKNKKKRKKTKAAVAAARSAALDAADRPVAAWRKSSDWKGKTWLCVVAFFCGFVLTSVWARSRLGGDAGGAAGAGGEGLGLPASLETHGVRERLEERAQPPVWVMAGGSLTLGDVMAPERGTQMGNDGEGFQWFKGGNLLAGHTRSFLTISAATLEDEGTYTCYAVEVPKNALWQEASVRISEPPTVESQLQTQRLARGEMLAIVATASGVPQPEYQWRRNGVPIPGATRPMLVRHSVTEADMGTYTCDVYNVAGSVQWEEMAVILREDADAREARSGRRQPSRSR